MSRFEEIGSISFGAKYTYPLSNEEYFPLNTPIDNKIYQMFAIGDHVPKQLFIEGINIPQHAAISIRNKTENFLPVMYRMKAWFNANNPGITGDAEEWMLFGNADMTGNYSLPSSSYSPYVSNGRNNFGYEQPLKGAIYKYINPIVNYNPNKIVVEPYLCQTYTGGGEYTDLHTSNALEEFNSDYYILHLDDIINDAILQAVPGGIENRKYELRYRLIYYDQGFISGRSDDIGQGTPFLCPRPIEFEDPMLVYISYGKETTATFKDTFAPLSFSSNILIGSKKIGDMFDSDHPFITAMHTTYSEWEDLKVSTGTLDGGHPYLSFSSLSGANRELYEQMKLTVVSLGCPFVTSMAAANDVWRNHGITNELLEKYPNSIFYPTIDKSTGKITTRIVSGEAAKTTPLKVMGDNGENPYDKLPVVDPNDLDENEYVDEIPIKTELPVNPTDVFQNRYAMSNLDLNEFAQYLWTSDTSIISRTLDGLKLNGENPMDFILSLKMFPFDLTRYADHSPVKLQFGNAVDTGIIVEKLSNANIIIELGEIDFRKYFKNFLDYEPYTTAKLYVPYCGEITVETALFVGHKIKITMIGDIITGSCCAVIYRDGIPCLYVNGNMSVDIQVTGQNMTEYVNATMNMINRETSDIGNIMSFGFSGGARSIEQSYPISKEQSIPQNLKNGASQTLQGTSNIIGATADGLITAYEWNHTPTPLAVCGSSSDLINWYKPQYAYFVIEQPATMPAADYGNQYGYACFDFGKLPNEGLVVCNNAHIQPPNATEPETTEINKLLNTGVWI